jgi:hypothetical protein
MKSKFPIYVRAMAIIMLIAMFHYVAGYRLMYSLGILYTKEEAKECANEKNDNIKKITLSVSDYNSLQWSEENKEFSLNHQMYDVVSIQKSGNSYNITAYADDPETELITAFHNFEKELFHPDQSTNGTKSAEDVMSSFQKDYTAMCEFKISIFSTGLAQLFAKHQGWHSLQVPDNIWHPPLIS